MHFRRFRSDPFRREQTRHTLSCVPSWNACTTKKLPKQPESNTEDLSHRTVSTSSWLCPKLMDASSEEPPSMPKSSDALSTSRPKRLLIPQNKSNFYPARTNLCVCGKPTQTQSKQLVVSQHKTKTIRREISTTPLHFFHIKQRMIDTIVTL